MLYGICNLSIVPLRLTTTDSSEMVSQVLFGEHFKILEEEKNWSKISLHLDNQEGYIDNKQYLKITESEYLKLSETPPCFSGELINFITHTNQQLTTIPIGSTLPFYNGKQFHINNTAYTYEGKIFSKKLPKTKLINIAFSFLNTPFLLGGKTPFGIDNSGFTQLVYQLCGYRLHRKTEAQATQGEVLSFIEESEPGDLAFFDNEEGVITHVGMIMNDYNIIHAYGKVRIDTLDHSGIYNVDTQKHTHKLRVIKRIV
ncbi:NlpC/P60 family protein [Tenacibaculum sp. UWU-22]|uniref:C40 family peptidase n=1 Tax=Tenacibaculum sp. UWU-22 TaxID=3234187 RepID=UPI0034DB4D7E